MHNNPEKDIDKNARLPVWMKKKRWAYNESLLSTKKVLREAGVNTVCESARCPNIGECFNKPTATFLIMGDSCTRSCTFCSVDKGKTVKPDPTEPQRIARVSKELSLEHVVITSVTRDDLHLGGAAHFFDVIKAVRAECSKVTIEVLTPDFKCSEEALRTVVEASPNIFNHNMETVKRLYSSVRPEADYEGSLRVFEIVKSMEKSKTVMTKSGFMLGLGEEAEEVEELMFALRSAGCDMLTIGQYLRPTKKNRPVTRYVTPKEFESFGKLARKMGFLHVFSAPFARSSFHAEKAL